VNDLVVILIWVVLIGGVFAYLWRKGYLLKISDYVQQTREELRKCTWPGWDELKGSTVVITISIGILGLFTYVVDRIFYVLVLWISKV
jgi:preprotein translocase subunit SecE